MKPCATCRTPLVRKRFACGAMESPAQFARRVYCDRACSDVLKKPVQTAAHPWKAPGLARIAYRKGKRREIAEAIAKMRAA